MLPVDHVGLVATTLYVDWLFTGFPFSFVWILSEIVSLLSMIVLGEDCSGSGGLSGEAVEWGKENNLLPVDDTRGCGQGDGRTYEG